MDREERREKRAGKREKREGRREKRERRTEKRRPGFSLLPSRFSFLFSQVV